MKTLFYSLVDAIVELTGLSTSTAIDIIIVISAFLLMFGGISIYNLLNKKEAKND